MKEKLCALNLSPLDLDEWTMSAQWMENMHRHNNGILKQKVSGYSLDRWNNAPVVFERAPLLAMRSEKPNNMDTQSGMKL